MVNHWLVWATEEDLGRQIPAQLETQRALDRDGLKRKFPDARWHIVAAFLAGDNGGFAA